MKKCVIPITFILLAFIFCVCYIFVTGRTDDYARTVESIPVENHHRYAAIHINREGKLNINTATTAELSVLDGIGETLAQRIVQYREEHGQYETVYDLLNVNGIGSVTLNDIIDSICTE